MTDISKVTIVHVFDKLSSNHLTNSKYIVNLLENNSLFLDANNVEYIIFDNLSEPETENFLLENISKIPSFLSKKIKYYKQQFSNGKNIKEIFLAGSRLANHPNIFFVFNEVEININTVFDIEKTTPFLQKKDIDFLKQNLPDNFQIKNYKLLMKKNKNFYDKLKIYFL